MRLLHVALIVPNSDQMALRNALRSISTEYKEYSWVEERAKGEDTSREILQAALEFQPDVVWMQLQDGTVLRPEDAAALPGITVAWSGDVRQPLPSWYWQLGRVIDLSLFSNEYDVDVMHEQGCQAAYMDIGFCGDTWSPNGATDPKYPEILFLGSNFGDGMFPLSKLRREMVERLAEKFGERFACYGHGWNHSRCFPLIEIADEVVALRSAKIAINLSHYDLERYSSDRLLRALGCGPLVLSHNYQGIEKDWKDGEHLIGWNSIEDLIEKIELYLEHQEIAAAIGELGAAEAHAKHTWDFRIQSELVPLLKQIDSELKIA
jgi:hypothetical protein